MENRSGRDDFFNGGTVGQPDAAPARQEVQDRRYGWLTAALCASRKLSNPLGKKPMTSLSEPYTVGYIVKTAVKRRKQAIYAASI
jgi:hypothetical protein